MILTPAFCIALAVVLTASAQSHLCAADPKPNVLILVSDDQGWADAGFQGSKDAATPHLDRLAASGIRCTNGYASHPFCSPSRAGLLTGRYQARFGHEYNPVYDPLDEKEGLPVTEKLLPQFLAEAGYLTSWVGKWHLGASPAHLPWNRGFADTFGFLGGGHAYQTWTPNERQYTLPLMRNGKEIPEVPEHLTAAFGAAAGRFIRNTADKPWMLYLAFNAPHTPHQPTPEREAQFSAVANAQRRAYLAQLSLLDDAVGTVMTALSETNQTQRTLVFFFSDNGGPVRSGACNQPLRGQKGNVYEGGVRVPFLVSWPSKLKPGGTFTSPVSALDVFATALAAAGLDMPKDREYDSVNLLPHLMGQIESPPHKRLFWRYSKAGQAVREGHWKLVQPVRGQAELYDLSEDAGEMNDLAAKEPEVTADLVAALVAWNKELIEPVFPGSSVKNEDWGPGGANQVTRLKKQPPRNESPKKSP